MTDAVRPSPEDIFADNQRWGDLDEWNRSAIEPPRARCGIHRIEREGVDPFWAVIDHAAVLEIERQPELFTNGPEPVLQDREAIANRQLSIKTLIHMDAPEHGKYRRLTNDWFKPASRAPTQRPPQRPEPAGAGHDGGGRVARSTSRSTSPCPTPCRSSSRSSACPRRTIPGC